MQFRVLFSNDTEEYYKINPMDIQMALSVEAYSFEEALIRAKAILGNYTFWPNFFEVVSIQKIDPAPEEELKLRPETWCERTGIIVMDPDGWRHAHAQDWNTPITREDFLQRAFMSTCQRFPSPLWDEEYEETTDIDRKRP